MSNSDQTISSKNIDPKIRFLVLFQDAQMKLSRISKITGTPESTLYVWKRKLENDVNFLEKAPKQMPPKVDPKTKEAIVREAQRSTKPTSSRKLAAKHEVSQTFVCTTLKEKGFKYGKIEKNDKNHQLSIEEEEDRIDFCEDMLKYRGSKIKRTFFSDEMGIRLSEVSDSAKSWSQSTKKKVKTESVGKDVKLNCWGAISWNGATSLHIFKGNLNNDVYQDILKEYAMEIEDAYPGKKVYFQQDNHPAHNDVEILDDHPNIELLDFPTYSPDLNPIENMWSTLKYRVACDAPKSENALEKSLQNNWQELTKVENIRPYLQTLEGRFHECIKQDGERLPY